MLFQEIVIHNPKRPAAERLAARKFTGPYRWRPSAPGRGRGFYTSQGDAFEVGDSTFRLRLEDANDILRAEGQHRAAQITGYYCDVYGADGETDTSGETLKPLVARLPRSRGFLAGWTMGEGMCAVIEPELYDNALDAAHAAHSVAEQDAEKNRDSQTETYAVELEEGEED